MGKSYEHSGVFFCYTQGPVPLTDPRDSPASGARCPTPPLDCVHLWPLLPYPTAPPYSHLPPSPPRSPHCRQPPPALSFHAPPHPQQSHHPPHLLYSLIPLPLPYYPSFKASIRARPFWANAAVITVLRNPVERVWSMYMYIRRKSGDFQNRCAKHSLLSSDPRQGDPQITPP